MIIRKTFKFAASHMVRNCTTERCSSSDHGHNFLVEVFLKSSMLDYGGMTLDFNLVKTFMNDFVDSFDHTYIMWNKELQEVKDYQHKFSKRWIELPVTPSAESLSIIFYWVLDQILRNIKFANGEVDVELHAVRIHETDTGYAEANYEDLKNIVGVTLDNIVFSEQIIKEWNNKEWLYELKNNIKYEAKRPHHQIV